MKRIDPITHLERSDKWYLGGGGRLLFAPPFPRWLDRPGFWDGAHFYNLETGPVFTWAILDEAGKEVGLSPGLPRWTPASRERTFHGTPATGIAVRERQSCLPNDLLASDLFITLPHSRRKVFHLVVWSSQRSLGRGGDESLSDAAVVHGRIVWKRRVAPNGRPSREMNLSLSVSPGPDSAGLAVSEGALGGPAWGLTPFAPRFSGAIAGGASRLAEPEGIVTLALHRALRNGGGKPLTVSIRFAAGDTPAENASSLRVAARQQEAGALAGAAWRDHFAGVPYFECSDEFFTRYYWYRWYGLQLNTIAVPGANYRHPVVCEGIGYFRAPISYSAPCHMRENRWRHDPALARGSLLTFLDHQRDDGGFRGYIDPHYYRQEMFYHADWGGALRELQRLHPDDRYLKEVYGGLTRYAGYFARERDRGKSGLFDITNHYETGQEFMSRYLAVDPHADRDNWGEIFRLKGVDAAVYLYELHRTLAWIAERTGVPVRERQKWRVAAARTSHAILSSMWDRRREMFFDVDPARKRRTGAKALTCFYPYLTDLVAERHLNGLRRHLLNRGEFRTPWPFPSSSLDDPLFSSDGEWKGKRMNCPWNGRVWPMTNSHAIEALATSAIRFRDGGLKRAAADATTRFVRMMFFDGDPRRPNCFEHYHPFNGSPSAFRGVDDYQHSWVVDLIMKYLVGFRPSDDRLVVDPFPFDCAWSVADDIVLRGDRWKVEREGKSYRVWRDGREVVSARIGVPTVISL